MESIVHHPNQDGWIGKDSCHLRGRRKSKKPRENKEVNFVPDDSAPVTSHWNHSSTFDGRLFLSRMKLENGSPADYGAIGILIVLLGLCFMALYFCYFHFQWFHFHVTHAYARIGHVEAQHLMGDKYLHGQGIDKDEVISLFVQIKGLLLYCKKLKSHVNTLGPR